MEELERIQQLKEEAMKTIDKSVKKKPCKTCKKKKNVIDKLPELVEIELLPTNEEIIEAYNLMQVLHINRETYEKINKVYKSIFNEDIPYGCSGCGNRHFRKFQHYIKNVLKLNVK